MNIKTLIVAGLIPLFFLPYDSSARTISEKFCKQIVEQLDVSSYPRKRQTFTIEKPACTTENGKDFLISQRFLLNTSVSRSAEYAGDMVTAIAPTLISGLCSTPQMRDTLDVVGYRLDFLFGEKSELVRSILVDDERCREHQRQVSSARHPTIEACDEIANGLRKRLPIKIGQEISRVDVKCRAGTTKTAAMVIYDQLLIGISKDAATAMLLRSEVRNGIISSQCVDGGFKSMLDQFDIVFYYTLSGQLVGEIIVSKDVCERLAK